MTCSAPLIEVLLQDGTYCRMIPKGLDLMLRHGRVRKFRRRDGWATVGIDPLRGEGGPHDASYQGPDRRRRGRCYAA